MLDFTDESSFRLDPFRPQPWSGFRRKFQPRKARFGGPFALWGRPIPLLVSSQNPTSWRL